MDELISKQAVITLLEEWADGYSYLEVPVSSIEHKLNELPTAELEIIRCKDCTHRDPEDKKCDCGHAILWQLPRDDNWYCADAERKPMDDLISRQAAIAALGEEPEVWLDTDAEIAQRAQWRADKVAVESVPTAGCEYWDTESNYCALHRPAAVPTTEKQDEDKENLRKFRKNPKIYTLDEFKAELGLTKEKRGKWIEQDDGWGGVFYECSCCKEAFTLIEGTPTDNNYYYCPNCGAKMGESDERK